MTNEEILKVLESLEGFKYRNVYTEEQIEKDRNSLNKLKEQLRIGGVSSSLLEIDLIDWDHTCGDGCCYTYGQDITLNGEKLDEQNAEDSKNALTAILTKLGYNVEINYR